VLSVGATENVICNLPDEICFFLKVAHRTIVRVGNVPGMKSKTRQGRLALPIPAGFNQHTGSKWNPVLNSLLLQSSAPQAVRVI
jgi:hypothetical protein